MLVALELQDDIHDMLQHFRTCQRTFLVNVSDKQDGCASALCVPEQSGSTLANLGQRTCRRFHAFCLDGLYGVDDNQVGLHLFNMQEYLFEGCLAEHEKPLVRGT